MGEGSQEVNLSPKMQFALDMAKKGELICAYGNQFFIAGKTHDDGVCERNTLEALVKRGLLVKTPDMTGRGRYVLAKKGTEDGKGD
jgi:hypothetical protein